MKKSIVQYKSDKVIKNEKVNAFFCCSILKHQFNTDILGENGTCVSNAVSLSSRKCSI